VKGRLILPLIVIPRQRSPSADKGSPVYCLGAAVTEFVFWQREPSLIGPNGYLRPAEGTLKRIIIGQSLQQSEGDETTAVSGALLLSMALGCARPRRRRLPPTRSERVPDGGWPRCRPPLYSPRRRHLGR
jgi:hypothetical protein